MRALGHEAELAADGCEGLDALRGGAFDLVLLDLVMPEIDGFAVLKEMKNDATLSLIPVLVISGLEAAADLAHAIEFGADDVLPKSIDAIILRARVGAALERRRLRLVEAAHLDELHKLSAAAHVIEETRFDPARLGLEQLRHRADDIGRLARVFLGMAEKVHRREAIKRRRVGLLLGLLFLAAFGAFQGLQPVFARRFAMTDLDPLGVAACSLLTGAAFMFVAASFGSRWTMPSRGRLIALIAYSAVSVAAPRILMLNGAESLNAQTISILIAIQPLLVFLLTAALGVEARSGRRLLGLSIGFCGIFWAVAGPGTWQAPPDPFAVFIVVLIPIGYALGVIALAMKEVHRSENQMLHSAIALFFAGISVTMIALATGAMPDRESLVGINGILIAGFGLTGAVASLAVLMMVRVTGAVFSSQSGYAATTGGVIWSAALLGEAMTAGTWIALTAVFAGFLLVMPREEETDFDEALSRSPKLRLARQRLGI